MLRVKQIFKICHSFSSLHLQQSIESRGQSTKDLERETFSFVCVCDGEQRRRCS